MEPKKASVDVAINAYGKPYQTAVTLFSLLRHSGEWIDKIYFVEEKKQPAPPNFKFIFDQLGERLVYYKPMFWFWYNKPKRPLFWVNPYRRSVRYQYAWEKTDKQFLLVIHNDVYFTGDLVKAYIENIGDHSGIGKVGQCWNCPAYSAQLCDGDRYLKYKPDYNEIMALSDKYPGPRSQFYEEYIDKSKPWPLPECRLNEYVAMLDIPKLRSSTVPDGTATPYGIINKIDTGVEWFHQVSNQGHTFAHFDYDPYAIHSWISLKNAGHEALFNKDLYSYEESVALQQLKDEFDIHPDRK